MAKHHWLLAGPWYRSQSIGGGVPKRSQRPVLQKYASANFANEIIKEPQRSLKFVGEDFVHQRQLPLNDPVTPGDPRLNNNPLKLFLDAHQRFYVVVCELHCDAPGLPNVARDKVIKAGFVIRKYASNLAYRKRELFMPVMKQRALINARISHVERQLRKAKKGSGAGGVVQKKVAQVQNQLQKESLAKLEAELARNTKELSGLKERWGVKLTTLGWCGAENESGVKEWSWDEVEAEPQKLEEAVLPLYPLIPDPNDANHSAKDKSIWFGVVPTFSSDVDKKGDPRFDDESLYEVRCFVRRHSECCESPQRGGGCCCGELVWSEPTESYQLAPYFDLDGCGHRPINITLPDLAALKDQVARSPAGKGANVRMKTPPDSSIAITTSDTLVLPSSGSTSGSGSICFFSIPLITIVAMFVFRLFLPIVVLIFQLWFLLSLRLCIPPSFSFDADLAVSLKAIGGSFKAEFDAAFSFDAGLGAIPGITLNVAGAQQTVYSYDDLGNLFDLYFDPPPSVMDKPLRDAMIDRIRSGDADEEEFNSLMKSILDTTADYSESPAKEGLAATLPGISDGLHYFEIQERAA